MIYRGDTPFWPETLEMVNPRDVKGNIGEEEVPLHGHENLDLHSSSTFSKVEFLFQ